jgi:hypothetical protein
LPIEGTGRTGGEIRLIAPAWLGNRVVELYLDGLVRLGFEFAPGGRGHLRNCRCHSCGAKRRLAQRTKTAVSG